jgi:hypothetical protein
VTEPYDMRSNIKGKPGSQGTLFQVKDKGLLNPQQRWPRGYTPERQAEVSAALEPTKVHPSGRVYPPRRADEVRARITDAISRSTVPTEHLAGLREVHDQPQQGHEATYWPGRKHLAVNMFAKHENRGVLGDEPHGSTEPDAGAKNLIHELGHHRDAATRETMEHVRSNKAILYAKNGRGRDDAAEAVADNYYTEHYRGPGRKGAQATQGRYEDTGLADTMPAYRELRPAMQGAQFQGVQETQPTLFEDSKARAKADAVSHAVDQDTGRSVPIHDAAWRAAAKTPWRTP